MERKRNGMRLLFLIAVVAVFANGTLLGSRSNREIKRQLKLLNKPAVKTIKSEDGEIMDCVDIYKQPSLDHPLLKNHTIQMRPSIIPKGIESKSTSKLPQQGWQKSGSCPEGTIPIRRTQKTDLVRATPIRTMAPLDDDSGSLEGSWADVTPKKDMPSFSGATAYINVWSVHVEPGEFSSSSVFVANNDNYINTGWHIYPEYYKDNKPHFYISWSADGDLHTGCYNLLCKGFIQVDRSIGLGGVISPLSTYDGDQYEVRVTLTLDHANQSWWLLYGTKLIGYWPLALFPNLHDGSHVRWSGEILNKAAGGHHTSTQMGSGHFSSEGFKRAAYFTHCKVRVGYDEFVPAGWAGINGNQMSCCDVGLMSNDDGLRFYYGGPGAGPNCP